MKYLVNIALVAFVAMFFTACSQSDDGLIVEEATKESNVSPQESVLTMLPRTLKNPGELSPYESPCNDVPGNCTKTVVITADRNVIYGNISNGTVSNFFTSGEAADMGYGFDQITGQVLTDLENGVTTLYNMADFDPNYEGEYVIVNAGASDPWDAPSY